MKPMGDANQPIQFSEADFSRKNPFGQALHDAAQAPSRLPLPLDFPERIAAKANQRDSLLHKKDRKLVAGFAVSILGLMFLGVIGWQVFRPIGFARVLDGPWPLVFTAMACLVFGAKMGRAPRPKLGL